MELPVELLCLAIGFALLAVGIIEHRDNPTVSRMCFYLAGFALGLMNGINLAKRFLAR